MFPNCKSTGKCSFKLIIANMDTLAHMSICNIQAVAKDSMKNEKHKLPCDKEQNEITHKTQTRGTGYKIE